MDVSVVIPTCDRPELLALTLRSVLWQQRAQIEILVVDDGREPGTQELIRRIGDVRVRLLRNTGPKGVSGARNTGILAATGTWIAFLDDDDLWAPDKLASQLTAARDTGAGWVYAGEVSVDESLQVIDGSPPAAPGQVINDLRNHNAVPAGASNVAVLRDTLALVGGFDPELRTSEDWDLWLRLAGTGVPACVPRPLVALRMHSRMASRNVTRMLEDIEVIARRHNIPVDRALHRRWAAWMCLQAGRRVDALGHYAHAVMSGDLASVGRAAVALTYPHVAGGTRRVSSDAWSRDAQTWLTALRQAPPRETPTSHAD